MDALQTKKEQWNPPKSFFAVLNGIVLHHVEGVKARPNLKGKRPRFIERIIGITCYSETHTVV